MATTTKTPKMTKASAFAIALELVNQSAHPDKVAVAEKISKEIENLSKKNSGTGKPTAKQTANLGLGEMVVAHLRANPTRMYTVTELMKSIEGLPPEITNQRMTALFRLDSVKPYFTRTMDKGKAYFQYKSPEEGDEDED